MTWPNWSGDVAAIIASGPSAKQADIPALKGRCRVIAIKENVNLCPWAEVVYGCDPAWWRHRRGLPDFKGIKIAWSGARLDEYPDIRRVEIKKTGPNSYSDEFLVNEAGFVGAGGNSGFQALNLAVQFGARKVLLIGFDMHGRSGEHWYGRNNWAMANNPTEDNYRRWRRAFERAASVITNHGVDVANASMISDLRCFRRASVAEALKGWGV